mmetsp:Transcript_21222/g.40396  ORF Transcript_21222/g.40396 Transcript_21222/m.40396 type:complete len:210 (+) Transcript_21222:517-1146(+)
MGAARFLSVFCRVHCDHRVTHEVLKLQRLHQVSVPHHALVLDRDVRHPVRNGVNLLHSLLERALGSEHRRVVLHGLLHVLTKHGCGLSARLIAQRVDACQGLFTCAGGQRGQRRPGLDGVRDGECALPAEHHNVQQRVGAQAVGAVHRRARRLPRRQQPRHNTVGLLRSGAQHLAQVVGGDSAHVVVHGGDHRNGLFGDVHAGEDGRRL